MGLDVRVYGNVKSAESDSDYSFKAFVISDSWKYKIKNLKENTYYDGDCIFRGISYGYSYHSRFREILVRLIDRIDLLKTNGEINWSELPSGISFHDFIDFADNEGCLDWEISEIIYLDFEKYNEKAKVELDTRTYSVYATWMKTFESAKNNRGVVVFT